MDTQELLKKIRTGGYDTAVGARRATGRVKLSAEDRKKVDREINKHFGVTAEAAAKPARGAKKAAKAEPAPKAPRKRAAPKDKATATEDAAAPTYIDSIKREMDSAAMQSELRTLLSFSQVLEAQVDILSSVGTAKQDVQDKITALSEGIVQALHDMEERYGLLRSATVAAAPAEVAPPEATPPSDEDWSKPLNGASDAAHA